DDATAQLAAAAKAAARDAPIRFELVQRYWNTDKTKLFATLEELSRTQKNASVHHELADLYNKLRRIDLMIRELEVVAKLEPTDDNLVALGEAYWVAGKDDQAIAAWKKIARAGTAKADAALGAVLFDHELTEDALDAYGRALKREPNDPELWRARGA